MNKYYNFSLLDFAHSTSGKTKSWKLTIELPNQAKLDLFLNETELEHLENILKNWRADLI